MSRRRQPAPQICLFDEDKPGWNDDSDSNEELPPSSHVNSSETGGTSGMVGDATVGVTTAPRSSGEADKTRSEGADGDHGEKRHESDSSDGVAGAVGNITGAPFRQWIDNLNR
jgi:hypothetical protein